MKRYLIFFWLTLTCMTSYAQNDSTSFLTKAFTALDDFSARNPVEKVYLQLDRSYYTPGDTVWFKAYVTAGGKHVPSGISNVLNVELVNEKNSVEQLIRLPLTGGLSWGDISLPDTLASANYRIVAYTNWMRNAGAEYFFDRPIRVGAVRVPHPDPLPVILVGNRMTKKQAEALLDKTDIQFFPESGSLVNGIRSKVAFKAMEDGSGREVNGIITDDSNSQITSFKSSHLGMGIFYLTPEKGKTYKASLFFADGTQCLTSLPAATDKGFVMNINNTDSVNVRVTVTASQAILNDPRQYGGINLVTQAGGKVYYTAKSKVSAQPLVAIIPKSKFPAGIVQFTLFSADGEPLNERIAFIEPRDQLRLSLSPDQKTGYSSWQKVKIGLNAIDSSRKPITGSFSVSVVNESVLSDNAETEPTIFSHLLLTSDLKGYIENPGYYFGDSDKAKSDLDILMLTQGYRHFEWKKILNGEQQPVKHLPEKTLSIYGHVTTPGGKPVAQAKVSLLSSQGGFMMLDTVTDQNGRFVFDKLMIIDSLRCKVQAHTAKNGRNVVVTVDDSLPKLPNHGISATTDSAIIIRAATPASQPVRNIPDEIPTNGHAKALKGVTIKATKPLLDNSSNLNGPGNADQVVLMKNIHEGCATIANCLQGKLNFVTISFNQWGVGSFLSRYGNMAIYVDGVPSNPELLNQMSPQTIESVEVLLPGGLAAAYGPGAQGGVILINTKSRGDYNDLNASNVLTHTIAGFQRARVFYSPKYDHTGPGNIADNRVTVYWKPNIITGKDGHAWIEYYNADTKGTYRVVVEGIDDQGRIGRQVYRYKVE